MFAVFAWPDINARGVGRIRDTCAIPKTKSRVCISVENSPNPSSVYIRVCKHRKKSFLLLLGNNFPEEKSKTLLFRALIKREILTSREVLYTKLVRVIQSLFCKKKCFPKYGFFLLKMSAQAKEN